MPKIIENLPQRLLEETQRQLASVGYSGLTIRSVAKACGVGVGTVYNYYPSKDALVVAYLLGDWHSCIAIIDASAASATTAEPVARCIYEQLVYYAGKHRTTFADPAAAASFTGSYSPYHRLLRDQLAMPLRKFCRDDFTAEFAAEGLLIWTMAGKPFDELYGVIEKLF